MFSQGICIEVMTNFVINCNQPILIMFPQVTIKDVYMKGAPRDLLPGDPVCAPIRTVLAESSVALIRSLAEYPLWKEHIASATLKGLQEVRNVLLLSSDRDSIHKNSSQANWQGFPEEDSEGKIQVRKSSNIVFPFPSVSL